MYFRVLGRLEAISAAGEQLQITRSGARALLTALLLRAGKPYPAEMLTRALWVNSQSADQAQQLRKAVWEARCALGGESARLASVGRGYQFHVQTQELDMLQFRLLIRQGGRSLAEGDNEQASSQYQEALSLWRHSPMSAATEEADHLISERRSAQVALASAMLAIGRHRQMLPGLREFTADNPQCERGWVQLILALCRSGRNCEALSACDQALAELRAGAQTTGCHVLDLRQRLLRNDSSFATLLDDETRWLKMAAAQTGPGP